MPRQRMEVRKIRQSLQLHFENGYSDRYIAQLCGISHPTVKKIRMLALAVGKGEITGNDRVRERDRGKALAGKSFSMTLRLVVPMLGIVYCLPCLSQRASVISA